MSYLRSRKSKAIVLAIVLLALAAPILLTSVAFGQTEQASSKAVDPSALKWGVVAAALSVGLACIGSAFAVAYVGAAAVAAVAEKPQLAGRTLIFVGLAEGIAIYGLIIAIMILAKV